MVLKTNYEPQQQIKPISYFMASNIDPTRTLTIRTKFVAAMKFQFAQLMAAIRHAVIELDVLALNKQKQITNAANVSGLASRQYEFMSSDQKIEEFVTWMNEQAKKYILSGGRSGIRSFGDLLPEATEARNSWIKTYIDSGYQQGIKRARQELKKKGIEIDDGSDGGSPIQVSFNNPMNADRVGMIYTRAYSSLKGITAEMDSVVSDVLALGIADGRGPREIARLLNKAITGDGTGDDLSILDSLGRKIPARRRAEVLARTEVIRAHHQANIAEYRAAGVLGIKVQAEWLTAGDARVCKQCAPMNGKRFNMDEAENIIPAHPQCRCVALPYIEEEKPISDGSIKNGQVGYEDTSQMPLSMSSGARDLADPEYREFIKRLTDKRGETREVMPKINELYDIANSDKYKLKEAEKVFFGLGGDKFKNIQIGEEFSALGTRSTAFELKRALAYGKDGGVFELTLPKGTHAVYSEVMGIKELMLLPGSEFEVTDILEGGVRKLKLKSDGSSYIKELMKFQKELDKIALDSKKDKP